MITNLNWSEAESFERPIWKKRQQKCPVMSKVDGIYYLEKKLTLSTSKNRVKRARHIFQNSSIYLKIFNILFKSKAIKVKKSLHSLFWGPFSLAIPFVLAIASPIVCSARHNCPLLDAGYFAWTRVLHAWHCFFCPALRNIFH